MVINLWWWSLCSIYRCGLSVLCIWKLYIKIPNKKQNLCMKIIYTVYTVYALTHTHTHTHTQTDLPALIWKSSIWYEAQNKRGGARLREYIFNESHQQMTDKVIRKTYSVHFCSVTQSCPTLCNPIDSSTPGFPVHHQLLELTQTHVHWVSDAIQPSHPLPSPSPPTFNLSQHQGLFKQVSSLHQVAKVLEFQLQHQSFQWILRTDPL